MLNLVQLKCKPFLHHNILQYIASIRSHIKNYVNSIKFKNHKFTGYWDIDNVHISYNVRDIAAVGLRLFSADFTNIFTNLAHNVILSNILGKLILYFKNASKKCLAFYEYNKTYYTDNCMKTKTTERILFTKFCIMLNTF